MWMTGDVRHLVRFCTWRLNTSIIRNLMKDNLCPQVSLHKQIVWLAQCVIKFVSLVLRYGGASSSSSYTDCADYPISLHPSFSSIAPCRSSKLHPVSTQSWCKYVLASQSTLVCPCVGFHRRMSLMGLSCFSNSVPHVLFVWLGWFLRWDISGCTTVVLSCVASRICSR